MGAERQRAVAETIQDIRQRFLLGHFPVATVDLLAGRGIEAVLGLVVSRAYNAEEAFFGMLHRATAKGAQAITGYRESVSFHPDGTRFYTCYGTAVRLRGQERQGEQS